MKKSLALFIVFVFGALLVSPVNFTLSSLYSDSEVYSCLDSSGNSEGEAPLESEDKRQSQQILEEEEEEMYTSVPGGVNFFIQISNYRFTMEENELLDFPPSILLPPPELV